MNYVYERIKQVRKSNNLNQTEFGEKLGVTRSVIKNIELNALKTGVPDNIIKLIAVTFNVDENWLRTGEGEMFNETSSTLIGQVAKEYNLDDFQQKLLTEYLTLTDAQKNAVKDFMKKVISEHSEQETETSGEYDKISVAEIDKKIDELERLKEKKQAVSSSAEDTANMAGA